MTSENPHYISHFFHRASPRRIVNMTLEFFRLEAAGGILLVLASILALIIANSPLYPSYDYFFNAMQFHLGFSDLSGMDFELRKSVLHWINDGMMAIFFLLVGLEIKREMMIGELSNRTKAMLPIIGAIGGMAVPALTYYLLNADSPETLRGWAIPCATDIAFALGVLSLLGSRVPIALKVLLTAVAIIDDIGAIIIIAFFYSDNIHADILFAALVPIAGLFLINRLNVSRRAPYILLGFLVWILLLKSGVHATLAGVITALFVPLSVNDPEERRSPAQRLENDLHPWVVFLILPLFGFANAGVPFEGMGINAFFEPVTMGIILGLVLGKQLGVFGAFWLAIKSGLCEKPEGVSWVQLYGLSILCGIGFTMSLFIGALAFTSIEMQAEVRIGVLTGSFISAVAAYIILRSTAGKATDHVVSH